MKKLLVFFLFLSSVCLSVMNAQTRMVTGKVFDDTGEPLAGAFVQIVGTTDGTSTDVDGHFILENVPSKAVLRVSYIGFDPIELPADKDYIEFEMKMNSLQINEVVVTGMQQMDKRMFTGATDNLKADEVLVSGIGEISRGLEGRSAGVSVQNISGTFGAAPKIRIRGATSIYG
ncbi:MAG: carboxypeptidase-like regulatory domain-containing protein, partial [Bacteroidales bacterium]|nr:carboxypeptidase-like regulatory domain-containing protein [Bacteroidales bacterium]